MALVEDRPDSNVVAIKPLAHATEVDDDHSLIRPHASISPPAASRQSRLVVSPFGSDSVVRRCPRHVLRQRSQFGISDGSRPWVKKRRATTPSPSRCTG
jgi:hypothetical protein